MAETLEELQKKREDIKTLLKTLEEAYSDASITEEHYKEVKEKNEKSLQDIEAEIKKMGGAAEAGEPESKGGRPKKEKEKKPKTVGEMIAAEMEVPVSQSVEESAAGIPAGEEAKPAEATPGEKPEEAPAKGREAGTLSAGDLQDILKKFVKELRPETSGMGDKLEKLALQFEKLRTFVDAIKDEKADTQENLRRMMEEIGEIRSTVNSLESRTSEQEIKMEEAVSTMRYLKTDQFVRDLQKKETELKTHEARIDKADDMLSMLVKKVTAIEDAFKDLGSLENVARFSQGLSAKIKEIDDREGKITKLADRINTIFMELNKRLEEFMFYKVKQDTLDELSQETMKSLEEVNTKLEGFASKEDLELLRNTVEQRVAEVAASAAGGAGGEAASPKLKQLESQREEIEGLLSMLDEQLAAKKIGKAEYDKTKKLNTKRLEGIEKQIMAEETSAMVGSAPAPAAGPENSAEAEFTKALEGAAAGPGKGEKKGEASKAPGEEAGPEAKPPETKAPAGPGETKAAERPEEKPKPAKDETKPSRARPAEKPGEKPAGRPKQGPKPAGAMKGPGEQPGPAEKKAPAAPGEEAVARTRKPAKEEKPASHPKPRPKSPQREGMLRALENSFQKGLISRQAYEKTKRMLGFPA